METKRQHGETRGPCGSWGTLSTSKPLDTSRVPTSLESSPGHLDYPRLPAEGSRETTQTSSSSAGHTGTTTACLAKLPSRGSSASNPTPSCFRLPGRSRSTECGQREGHRPSAADPPVPGKRMQGTETSDTPRSPSPGPTQGRPRKRKTPMPPTLPLPWPPRAPWDHGELPPALEMCLPSRCQRPGHREGQH